MAERNLTNSEIAGILAAFSGNSEKIKICITQETLCMILKCISVDEELETRQINREEKLRIAQDSNSSPVHLEDLSWESDREILQSVAANLNTPPSVLQRFLYLNDDKLPQIVLRNLSLSRQSAITAGMDYSIDKVNFSTRTVRTLHNGMHQYFGYNNGPHTLVMVSILTEEDLKMMRNLGNSCLSEIKSKLAEYGLSLS